MHQYLNNDAFCDNAVNTEQSCTVLPCWKMTLGLKKNILFVNEDRQQTFSTCLSSPLIPDQLLQADESTWPGCSSAEMINTLESVCVCHCGRRCVWIHHVSQRRWKHCKCAAHRSSPPLWFTGSGWPSVRKAPGSVGRCSSRTPMGVPPHHPRRRSPRAGRRLNPSRSVSWKPPHLSVGTPCWRYVVNKCCLCTQNINVFTTPACIFSD